MSASPVNTHQDDDPDHHLSRLAALELARRSAYGVFMHPCLLLIFAVGGSIAPEYPLAWAVVIAFLLLLALSRFFLTRGFEGHYNQHGEAMVVLFALLMALHNLVISDVQMPKMRGDELAREILQVRDDQAIILCSGYSRLITEDEALAMGVRCYLAKPIRRQTLTNSIRGILDEATWVH